MHLSGWAEILLGQWEYVGSAVKVADSDDVFGTVSVVNLHQHKVCKLSSPAESFIRIDLSLSESSLQSKQSCIRGLGCRKLATHSVEEGHI